MRVSLQLFSLLCCVLISVTSSGQKLVNLELLDGKISMMIPDGLKLMDHEIMTVKYPSEQRPQVVYTNKRGTINVALNYTQSKATQEGLEDYRRVLKESMKNSQPSAEWLGDSLQVINGRKVGYLELITPAKDARIYNLLFFTDVENRLAIFSFNCTFGDTEVWRDVAHFTLRSLEVHQ